MSARRFHFTVLALMAALAAAILGLSRLAARQSNPPARPQWVVFLAPPGGAMEVWARPLDGGQAVQLSHTDGKVLGFTTAPDGKRIAYVVENGQGGADLWLMGRQGENPHRLVDCGAQACFSPAWSPDGVRIAYSRGPLTTAYSPTRADRVWTVEAASGRTAPLYQDAAISGSQPSWSPDGRRIASYDAAAGAIRVLDLRSGHQDVFQTDAVGVTWSPDGQELFYNVAEYIGEQPHSDVYRADLTNAATAPFIQDDAERVDCALPAWSPDGRDGVIACRPGNPEAERLLYLIGLDGKMMSALPLNPAYNYSAYRWDAAGEALLFQRFRLEGAQSAPDVLVWQRDSGQVKVVVQGAALPAWLP
jgi:TolB protein